MKKRLSVVATIAAACILAAAPPAAATDVGAAGTVVASGAISPGLTFTPMPQSAVVVGTVSGTARVGSAVWSGQASCSFNMAGASETVATGVGTATGGCSTPVGGISSMSTTCALSYSRVGLFVITTGGCAVTVTSPTGSASGTGSQLGVLTFMPTSFNPTVSFVLLGTSTVVH